MRIIVAGAGVAGLYFTYRLLRKLEEYSLPEIVLVNDKPFHEFLIGIPIAFAGLARFEDLVVDLRRAARVRVVVDSVTGVSVDSRCVSLSGGGSLCGDFLILALGSRKIGGSRPAYYTVAGAAELHKLIFSRKGPVRFIVNVLRPMIGFQEIALAIKHVDPGREVSIHVLNVDRDYEWVLEAFSEAFNRYSVVVSRDPPEPRLDAEDIVVPEVVPHPLLIDLDVSGDFFEVAPGVHMIGDSSLIKFGLPPIGWGAIWQASTLAEAIGNLITRGVMEAEVGDWVFSNSDRFVRWFTYRMARGAPLVELRGLLDMWLREVVAAL